MKLKEACEIATECGLKTIKEAIINVTFHSSSLFTYKTMEEEIDELYKDFEDSKLLLSDSVIKLKEE